MQVCLIKAQVKSGAGVRSEWWRTDRPVTHIPSILPFVCLSVHLFICSSVHLSIHPFIHSPIYPFIHSCLCDSSDIMRTFVMLFTAIHYLLESFLSRNIDSIFTEIRLFFFAKLISDFRK